MNEWLEEKYKEGLTISRRYESMKKALDLLSQHKGNIIVETGTIRLPDDWGAGMSTLIFGDYAQRNHNRLITVDNNYHAIEVCKKVTSEFADSITYVVNDSLEFLKGFNQTIDLLYLDSMDCPEYDSPDSLQLIASQSHQLRELTLAIPKLSENPIILLDDNDFENGGKTKLSKEHLLDNGFKEVHSGKQSLWTL